MTAKDSPPSQIQIELSQTRVRITQLEQERDAFLARFNEKCEQLETVLPRLKEAEWLIEETRGNISVGSVPFSWFDRRDAFLKEVK